MPRSSRYDYRRRRKSHTIRNVSIACIILVIVIGLIYQAKHDASFLNGRFSFLYITPPPANDATPTLSALSLTPFAGTASPSIDTTPEISPSLTANPLPTFEITPTSDTSLFQTAHEALRVARNVILKIDPAADLWVTETDESTTQGHILDGKPQHWNFAFISIKRKEKIYVKIRNGQLISQPQTEPLTDQAKWGTTDWERQVHLDSNQIVVSVPLQRDLHKLMLTPVPSDGSVEYHVRLQILARIGENPVWEVDLYKREPGQDIINPESMRLEAGGGGICCQISPNYAAPLVVPEDTQ